MPVLGERRLKGDGRGEALCIVEKIRGVVEGGGDQSEHEIDMHKKQIHSLRAEHRTLQHMQVSHLANTSKRAIAVFSST